MPLAPFEPFKPSKQNPDQALIAFLNDHIRKLNTLIDTYGLDGTDLTLPGGGTILNGITVNTGCIPSNGTDATNDIDFSTGVQRDSSNIYTIKAGSVFTKRADATFATGTGNGGMATGSFSATADYHLHLLGKSTDPEAFDYIFDTSATCANGLANAAVVAAGFDIYKRVSSLRTGGSAAWPLITAREIGIGLVEYLLKTPSWEFTKSWSGGADNTAQTGTLALAPGGVQVNAIITALIQDSTASANSSILVTALDQTDTAADAGTAGHLATLSLVSNSGGNARATGVVKVRTSTSRTFRYRASGSTTDHVAAFSIMGWEDSRL